MIALLVNPAAGGGRAAAHALRVEQSLRTLGDVYVLQTRARGDEERCVREAQACGARILAVVGGDGSVHHTVRGLLAAQAALPLAIYSAGTGNDFVKTLGTPSHDIAAMTACVAHGQVRAIDVGYIDGIPFVNAAGLGFDVDVLQRMLLPMRLRGTAAYVSTALRALLGYPGFSARLSRPTAAPPMGTGPHDHAERHRLMTVFANGRCFGGTFHIAPQAQLDDGQLEVIDIGHVAPFARAPLFVRAVLGRHLRVREVQVHRGDAFTLAFGTPPTFEADGELYRANTTILDVRIRPAELSVIVPAS